MLTVNLPVTSYWTIETATTGRTSVVINSVFLFNMYSGIEFSV